MRTRSSRSRPNRRRFARLSGKRCLIANSGHRRLKRSHDAIAVVAADDVRDRAADDDHYLLEQLARKAEVGRTTYGIGMRPVSELPKWRQNRLREPPALVVRRRRHHAVELAPQLGDGARSRLDARAAGYLGNLLIILAKWEDSPAARSSGRFEASSLSDIRTRLIYNGYREVP